MVAPQQNFLWAISASWTPGAVMARHKLQRFRIFLFLICGILAVSCAPTVTLPSASARSLQLQQPNKQLSTAPAPAPAAADVARKIKVKFSTALLAAAKAQMAAAELDSLVQPAAAVTGDTSPNSLAAFVQGYRTSTPERKHSSKDKGGNGWGGGDEYGSSSSSSGSYDPYYPKHDVCGINVLWGVAITLDETESLSFCPTQTPEAQELKQELEEFLEQAFASVGCPRAVANAEILSVSCDPFGNATVHLVVALDNLCLSCLHSIYAIIVDNPNLCDEYSIECESLGWLELSITNLSNLLPKPKPYPHPPHHHPEPPPKKKKSKKGNSSHKAPSHHPPPESMLHKEHQPKGKSKKRVAPPAPWFPPADDSYPPEHDEHEEPPQWSPPEDDHPEDSYSHEQEPGLNKQHSSPRIPQHKSKPPPSKQPPHKQEPEHLQDGADDDDEGGEDSSGSGSRQVTRPQPSKPGATPRIWGGGGGAAPSMPLRRYVRKQQALAAKAVKAAKQEVKKKEARAKATRGLFKIFG